MKKFKLQQRIDTIHAMSTGYFISSCIHYR